jgi:hypothetical protein
MNTYRYFLSFVVLVFLLTACGTPQQPEVTNESSFPESLPEGVDHHFDQMEALANGTPTPFTLTAADGGTLTGTAMRNSEGELVYEGDIIVGKTGELSSQGHIGKNINLWWRGIVPYKISSRFSSSQRANILAAISHIESQTNVNFVSHTNQPNYVAFIVPQDGQSCDSLLGKAGGYQSIRIAPRCGTGIIIHEIGHALGLLHEHSRSDRDTYIRIACEKFAVNPCNNPSSWGKVNGTLYGKYDINSVMHYKAEVFAEVNGVFQFVQLIYPKAAANVPSISYIGNTRLSSGDIATLKRMYP